MAVSLSLFFSVFFKKPLDLSCFLTDCAPTPGKTTKFDDVKAFAFVELGADLSFIIDKLGPPKSTSVEAGGFRISKYSFPHYDLSIVYDRSRKIMQYGALIKVLEFKPEIPLLRGVFGRAVTVGGQPFGAIDPESFNPILLSPLASDAEPFEYYELLNDNPATDIAVRFEYIKPRIEVPKSAVLSSEAFEKLVDTIQSLGCHYGIPPGGGGLFTKAEFRTLEHWRSVISPNAFTVQRPLEDDEINLYVEHIAADKLCEKQ